MTSPPHRRQERHSLAPEVVRHEEATIEQIFTEALDLIVAQRDRARIGDVDKRIFLDFITGEFDHLAVRVGLDGGELLDTIGKVEIGIRIISSPTATTSSEVIAVLDSNKGEDIPWHLIVKLPVGHAAPSPQSRPSSLSPCNRSSNDGYCEGHHNNFRFTT